MLVDPGRLPETETTLNAVDNRPSPFANAATRSRTSGVALPGEAGIRNLLRGDGYFTIDTSISKAFARDLRPSAALPLGHLQRDQHGEVRRRPVAGDAGCRWLRPLQRHAGDLRRAGGPLHAVRAALRVLSFGAVGGRPVRTKILSRLTGQRLSYASDSARVQLGTEPGRRYRTRRETRK